jgi:hypothetical protein
MLLPARTRSVLHIRSARLPFLRITSTTNEQTESSAQPTSHPDAGDWDDLRLAVARAAAKPLVDSSLQLLQKRTVVRHIND